MRAWPRPGLVPALPPPRGPRPRRTAGPVTLAQPPPPRSIVRSRPQLASSSSLSAQQRKPDRGTRGFTGSRQGVQARARSGGAGAASRELLAPPSRRSRRRCWVSCHRRPVRRAGFVFAARGAGCQGTGGHALPSGRRPLRGRLLWLRPVSALRAALRCPAVAGPSRSEGGGGRGCVSARDRRIRSGSAERAARRRPSRPAKPRFRTAGGLAEVGFLRKSVARLCA